MNTIAPPPLTARDFLRVGEPETSAARRRLAGLQPDGADPTRIQHFWHQFLIRPDHNPHGGEMKRISLAGGLWLGLAARYRGSFKSVTRRDTYIKQRLLVKKILPARGRTE